MQVFISWSGERSQKLALRLEEWLKNVIQGLEVFISSDIPVGRRWFDDIATELAKSDFCIACLTPENFRSSWMLFEAGAIAVKVGRGFACAYLLDMRVEDLERHPLSHFQMALANRTGTWKLVKSINGALPEPRLDEGRLKKAFDRWWSDLAEVLEALPNLDSRELLKSYFSMINKASGSCLEVAEGSRDDGAAIRLAPFLDSENQLWRLQEAERGYFFITARHSGKCLDVKGRSRVAGEAIHQYAYKGGDNQQWTVTSSPAGYYRIAARHSGLYLSSSDGASVHQEESAQDDSQRWLIRLVEN